MNVSFFRELLDTIVDRGRALTNLTLSSNDSNAEAVDLGRQLLSRRGESTGAVLAQRILNAYASLPKEGRLAFFTMLATDLAPDVARVLAAAAAYSEEQTPQRLQQLSASIEPPRQEFFRRLNLAPGGTSAIVGMRADLLDLLKEHPELRPVDEDIVHLFGSWFNRGFLVLRRIDWSTPANILEKIIQYEAVHEIHGWDDLKRRLDPQDRRCYAFFHPSLIDEPLIFVEVALVHQIEGSIEDLIRAETAAVTETPNTAVFYSISNCQKGLAGISFGNFLIKQVVTDLSREIPSLKTFVTLSPVPGFKAWLDGEREAEASQVIGAAEAETLSLMDQEGWYNDTEAVRLLKPLLCELGAHYFVREKRANGQPLDPVARFHLGNGARLERINWPGDLSPRGLAQAAGLMVNYLYDLKDIEKNHEAYAEQGKVVSSSAVTKLARTERSRRSLVPAS
ncbi:malonyl-CoA decarboxylase [Rhodoligotrophos appendicifer]|uniref:malonyl-CoA decarboxylase n=1 Tax=Rhodoligotrophos appendicifer TaxID=987056 RepID=UPI00117F1704|nr:malonyl-CoA decarboxylase [Rhodoligotrophos appendicifer]